jgi:hypothetical protein
MPTVYARYSTIAFVTLGVPRLEHEKYGGVCTLLNTSQNKANYENDRRSREDAPAKVSCPIEIVS